MAAQPSGAHPDPLGIKALYNAYVVVEAPLHISLATPIQGTGSLHPLNAEVTIDKA